MTDKEFRAQDQEALDMVNNARKGIKQKITPGAYQTITLGTAHKIVEKPAQASADLPAPPELDPDQIQEAPDAFQDYPVEEPDADLGRDQTIRKIQSICRNVLPLAAVSFTFSWGVLSGNVTGSMGWPISWGCSILAAFLAGVIIFKK